MFRWNLMLRTRFGSRRQEPKARRSRTTVRPYLEVLEDRTLPSASSLPLVTVASPPAVPQLAAITSFVDSMVQQRLQVIATIVQDASNIWSTLDQEIVQEVAALQLQVGHILGFDTNTPSLSSNAAVSQRSGDSGAVQGRASGFGSGSSGATATAHDAPHPRFENALPLTDSGSGSGDGAGPYSGSATVTGWVWLDNNADGSQDQSNVEMDYSGATVDLLKSTDNGVSWSFCSSTTTSSAEQGYNYSLQTGFPVPNNWLYKIQVVFPSYFAATTPSAQSKIDAQGYSTVFSLPPGAMQVIPAGLVSMNVNTTADDPNGPTQQNTVTLRDAMLTGNSLKPFPAVTFYTNPQTGQQLSGSIGLQQALPSIQQSYYITGPGASTLAVDGNDNAGTIFTVNAGVGSTISGLTITGGSGANGGGINDNGNLTLNADIIKGNQTTGNGGGIDNGKGSLRLTGDQILGNSAGGAGGGLYNAGGTVTITGGTVINGNKAADATVGHGGGICNYSGTMTVSGGTVISTNSAGVSGGGVHNLGTFNMTGGKISSNTAPPTTGAGGGVENLGSMKLLGVQVQGNSAGQGAGIFTWLGKLVLGQNTTISGNKASSGGAGIWVQSGTAAMVGGGVTNNTAQQDGGGIYVYGGQLMLSSGVLVSGNHAAGSGDVAWGGGIFIRAGKVTVSGGTVSANQSAFYSGGGIYNFGGTLTLQESVSILGNEAYNQGGGVYLANSSTTTFNGVTVKNNETYGNQQTTGPGVYQQNNA